jgi:hypothetical protein
MDVDAVMAEMIALSVKARSAPVIFIVATVVTRVSVVGTGVGWGVG